jgi:D-xylose transport system permease protein
LIAIAIIWGFFSFMTDGGFVTPRNLSNLLRQMSVTGILACGMVLVIIAGEIDLSVGSLLGLWAASRRAGREPSPAAGTEPGAGAGLRPGIGLLNGYLTAYLGIPSFIVGLGGMLAFRGILLGIPAASPSRRCRTTWSISARATCRRRSAWRWASPCSCWPWR